MSDEPLSWRCRRGNREVELMLLRYLERRYPHSDREEQSAFRRLLELPEAALQRCLLGLDQPHDMELAELARQIRAVFDAGA